MSTRGRIAIKENGKYTYIYNHCDSYIDGLGIILYKFYTFRPWRELEAAL